MNEKEIDLWLKEMGFVKKPEPRSEEPKPRPVVDGYGWYRRGEECPF